MKAHKLATAGLLTAIQIITLLIAYVVPTIKLALLFAVSLYPGILLHIGFDKKAVFASFAASAILLVFLIQIPELQGGFIAFFGWYALVHEGTKKMARIKKQLIRWALFAVSAGLMYLVVRFVFPLELKYELWIIAITGAVAFIAMQAIYELCVREIIRRTKIKSINGKITFK